MVVALSVDVILLLGAVVLLAGALNGVAGFGFALVGTTVLAAVISPSIAVVFMILPILSVNLSLVRDLSYSELRSCGQRFAPLLGAALVGTIAGMALLDRIPERPLRVGLGVLSLAFVLSAQNVLALPGRQTAKDRCFVETRPAMVGVGAISGLLFGGTNIGVQLIAYLRSCDLSHATFVGVVAMVFLGLNGVRVAVAGLLGLYTDTTVLVASFAATIPAVTGVGLGKRLRSSVGEQTRRAVVLSLLTIVGVRLISTAV
jgi:uncharacterized membrane protein YfcA